MDIKWQMAMLTLRMKRFIKRSGRNNFSLNKNDAAGFDKSKVRCYKCNNLGHFARECRGDSSSQQFNNTPQPSRSNNNRFGGPSQALVSQEGMGFDWSDQAEEAIQNQALMASTSEAYTSEIPTEVKTKLCKSDCLSTVKKYRDHNQELCDKLKKMEQIRNHALCGIYELEQQVKALRANETQVRCDMETWRIEKSQFEVKLIKSSEELETVKKELDEAKANLEK